MLSHSLMIYTLLVLLKCTAVVHGGNLQVRFSEDDYVNREDEGLLNLIVVVTGGTQEFGPLVFQIQALTVQQFRDQNPVCVDPDGSHDLLADLNTDATEADVSDLNTTTITCSRQLGLTNDIACSFPLTQDPIVEGDEYLALVLTVLEDSNNTITLKRNCAIGTILIRRIEFGELMLSLVEESIKVREGNTTKTFITIERNFETTLPVEIIVTTFDNSPRDGAIYYTPRESSDYVLNRNQFRAIFPANETRLRIPVDIRDDNVVEQNEYFGIRFDANINNVPSDVIIAPSNTVDVTIEDNDIVTTGLNVSDDTVSVSEGEPLTLCAGVTSLNPLVDDIQRTIRLDFTIADGTAISEEDFRIVRQSPSGAFVEFGEQVCYTFEMIENSVIDGPRSFQVMIVDLQLALLSDPAERARYMALNLIQPSTVTVSILDNDGTPGRPSITKVMEAPDKKTLAFEWAIDEENGRRPVDCYYGNITELAVTQHDQDDKDDSESATELVQDSDNNDKEDSESARETAFMFDFCDGSSPKAQEYVFQEFDSSKEYRIVVCSRNSLGVNCSEVEIFSPPTPAPVTSVGLIVGVVVAVVVFLCCCLILILLLCLIFCCGWEREKRYFPQRREKQFAKGTHSHTAHYSVAADEFDIVKEPLDYDV